MEGTSVKTKDMTPGMEVNYQPNEWNSQLAVVVQSPCTEIPARTYTGKLTGRMSPARPGQVLIAIERHRSVRNADDTGFDQELVWGAHVVNAFQIKGTWEEHLEAKAQAELASQAHKSKVANYQADRGEAKLELDGQLETLGLPLSEIHWQRHGSSETAPLHVVLTPAQARKLADLLKDVN